MTEDSEGEAESRKGKRIKSMSKRKRSKYFGKRMMKRARRGIEKASRESNRRVTKRGRERGPAKAKSSVNGLQ